MIDARHLGNVIDVVDQHAERRPRNLRRPLLVERVRHLIRNRLSLGLPLRNLRALRRLPLRRLSGPRIPPRIAHERRIEVDHHHAALALRPAAPRHRTQHVVRHVARSIRQRPSR